MTAISFEDSDTLGRYTEPAHTIASLAKVASAEEIKAAYDHITELKISLAEMVLIYWGDGDGIEPAPSCIQRAQAALAEEVR